MIFRRVKEHKHISGNAIPVSIIGLYLVVLLLAGSMVCYFSYTQKKQEILSQIDFTFEQLKQEYEATVTNFWQIYMPIFENRSEIDDEITSYFTSTSTSELSPIEKNSLSHALNQMLARNTQIQWIALFSNNRDINYILFQTENSPDILPDNFPYFKEMSQKQHQMEIYGMKSIYNNSSYIHTFAISGGIPFNMGDGQIIVGYSPSTLEQICQNAKCPLNSLRYSIRTDNQLLFDSKVNYTDSYIPQLRNSNGIFKTKNGTLLYNYTKNCGYNYAVSYQFSPQELFLYSHHNTPLIFLAIVVFFIFSLYIYTLMLKRTIREVDVIRNGLHEISKNQLTYQLPTDFNYYGLHEIAKSINQMTCQLNETINKTYHYELMMKKAELSELQSKFNPHFLYNSLEMICSRCYQNGDHETADLITQLAAIFRGFINAKNFIPLQEELAFSKRYLVLFGARYKDQVQIRFDIDTDLLQYGIIRNVFQPLIENYFIHGFNTGSETHNYICFHGKSVNESVMMLSVEDNGIGMTDKELEQLNASLTASAQSNTKSYGLKNLHQRLQLFYGSDFGLSVIRNPEQGITIQMKLLKMTCEDYENSN